MTIFKYSTIKCICFNFLSRKITIKYEMEVSSTLNERFQQWITREGWFTWVCLTVLFAPSND